MGVDKNAEFFQFWAGEDTKRWSLLEGYTVFHEKYGRGEIQKVYKTDGYLYIDVLFRDYSVKHFTKDGFAKKYLLLTDIPEAAHEDAAAWQAFQKQLEKDERERKIHEELAQRNLELQQQEWARIRRYESETEARKEFRRLKIEYECPSSDVSPTSPLFRILLQIKDNEPLVDEDLEILKDQKCFYVLAVYYERQYCKTGKAGDGAKASANWRKARHPEKVLAMELPRNGTKKARAAFFTSRGAALADLGMLKEAREIAEKAIKLNPRSYHPYNLLGRIAYLTGDYHTGDEFFAKARNLGASEDKQDMIREDTIKHLSIKDRCKTAQYLFNKDPIHYSWAKKYLQD